MLGNMCVWEAYCKSTHFFPHKAQWDETCFCAALYTFIVAAYTSFLGLSFFLPTEKICLVLSCFYIPIPHHRNQIWDTPSIRAQWECSKEPFPMGLYDQLRRECLGRKMGNVSHSHYLLAQIFHAVFLNHLSTKINVSLFPTVSSNWHLPQPAWRQCGFWKVHKRDSTLKG